MYTLTPEETKTFREEYQQKEGEIQKYIGVYLSGLVIVTGWIVGPQSDPVLKMVLGNGGYNIYAVLIIVSLNVLFLSFLMYKSLIVHEITQFMTFQGALESGFSYWENWRRSPYSATRRARNLYSFLLSILPAAVSALLMYGLWKLLRSDPGTLVDQLHAISPGAETASPANSSSANPAVPDPSHLLDVMATARVWYYVVLAFHLVPLLFLYWNWFPNDRRWDAIISLRKVPVFYDELANALKNPVSGRKAGPKSKRES